MGMIDRIKNALFEVEYVEVKDKKEEKKKEEIKEEVKEEKPIAKKVVLSNKRERHHEREKEDVGMDEEYVKPKPFTDLDDRREEETIERERVHSRVESRNDRYEDEYPEEIVREERPSYDTEIERNVPYKGEPKRDFTEEFNDKPYKGNYTDPMDEDRYPDDDYYNSYDREQADMIKPIRKNDYIRASEEVDRVIYKQDKARTPYGIDKETENLVQDYGKAYDRKEEKTIFRPSPVISPVYGVLDKNYKKEDVVTKKEVVRNTYKENTRDSRVSIDDIRDKAYGNVPIVDEFSRKLDRRMDEVSAPRHEAEPVDLFVDLSKEADKPSIKEVTMGDAMEYFNDLGLEYNVDYVDATKEKAHGRRSRDHYDDEPELFALNEEVVDDRKDRVVVEDTPIMRRSSTPAPVEADTDDNLFDLIDSMYQDK